MIKLLTFIFLIHVGSLTAQLNFQYFNQETLGTQIKFDVTAAYNQSVMNKMLLGYDNLFVVTYLWFVIGSLAVQCSSSMLKL